MARQFHVEITSTEGNMELYIHDNNDVEQAIVPPVMSMDHMRHHLDFFYNLACFMRCHNDSKLEATKVP